MNKYVMFWDGFVLFFVNIYKVYVEIESNIFEDGIEFNNIFLF